MKLIKLINVAAGPSFAGKAGDIVEVSDEIGENLVEAEAGVEVILKTDHYFKDGKSGVRHYYVEVSKLAEAEAEVDAEAEAEAEAEVDAEAEAEMETTSAEPVIGSRRRGRRKKK